MRRYIKRRLGFCAVFGLGVVLLLATFGPRPSKAQVSDYYVFANGSSSTANRLTKWTATAGNYYFVGNSLVSDDGTHVTLNGASAMRLIFPDFSLLSSSGLGGSAEFRNPGSTAYVKVRMAGLLVSRSDSTLAMDVGQSASDMLALNSGGLIAFAQNTSSNATKDTSAGRASAGVWQFGDGGANANGKVKANLGVQLGTTTAKGTCDSSARGTLYTEFGGAGVADKIYQCLKGSADSYSWVQIASAP